MAMLAPRDRDDGFTLLEVTGALLLLATAAAGVAVLSATSLRAALAARQQTSATALAVQKVEQLRALTWTFDENLLPVSDLATSLAVDTPAGGGPGLGASPAGALEGNTPGHVDFLDANGRWVGTGVTPPPGAVFVRRWRVEPLSADPAHTLIIQVLVMTVPRAGLGDPLTRLPGDARLVSALTRKAR